MYEKIKNYAYYIALIFFFAGPRAYMMHGAKYSGFASDKNFSGTKFGLLIYLNTIGGYILTWLGSLGLVIATYVYKNL